MFAIGKPRKDKSKEAKPSREKRRPSVEDDDDERPPYDSKPKRSSRRMETPRLPPERPRAVNESARGKKRTASAGFDIDQEASDLKPSRKKTRMVEAVKDITSDLPNQRALALIPQTDADIRRAVISSFGEKSDRVLSMLESNDSDGAISLLSRSLIQMLIGVLPLAEANVRSSSGQRGIYQLNQLVSGIREMMVDLNNLRDKGDLGRSIVERYLRPSYQDLGVQLTLIMQQLSAQAKSRMSPEDYREYRKSIDEATRSLATYMFAQYNEVKEGVASALS